MHRSAFFNRRFPAPTDSFVFPFFEEYKGLLKEVVQNWRADVVNQNLRNRDFIDLQDCRIDFKGDAESGYTPVISLVPLVGQETLGELAFYKRFLDTYVIYRNDIIKLITYVVSGQADVDYDERKLSDKQRYNEHSAVKLAINRYIMLVKSMVTAMAKGKLEMHHLDILSGVYPLTETTFDDMFRDMDIAQYISNKFERGGHFYDGPDSGLVQAFWNYTKSLHTFNTRGPVNADPEQWRDPDEAPELGKDFFENAEIRQGDKVIREGKPKLDEKRTTPRAMTLDDINRVREEARAETAGGEIVTENQHVENFNDVDSEVMKNTVEQYIAKHTIGGRDASTLKTLDSFLDEEGIRDEVTATAQERVEKLKKDPSS